MYKDKDKQREAQREWIRRKRVEQSPKEFKIRAEGTFAGSTKQGSTKQGSTGTLVPKPRYSGSDTQSVKQADEIVNLKRGKDIKCFEDLPPDVQQTINRLSAVGGTIDKFLKANRTAIAINYQHMSPDRYYPQDAVISSPVVTGKPGDADYNGICTEAWRAEHGR